MQTRIHSGYRGRHGEVIAHLDCDLPKEVLDRVPSISLEVGGLSFVNQNAQLRYDISSGTLNLTLQHVDDARLKCERPKEVQKWFDDNSWTIDTNGLVVGKTDAAS